VGLSSNLFLSNLFLSLILALLCGCTGWKMDYSDPAVQVLAEDLREKGTPFIGKKITVRGKVTSTDTSDPKSCWIILEGNIRCHYGKFQAMAQEVKVGEMINIDGVLSEISDSQILLDPAQGRDPLAPFNPLK